MYSFGEVTSKLVEDTFRDESFISTNGNNKSSNYFVMMKHYISAAANARIVHQDVPLRHHQAMHPMLWASQETVMPKQRKKTWTDYVNTFIQPNPDIPLDYFRKWNEIIKRVDTDNRTNEQSLTLKDTTNEAKPNT